MRERTSGAKAHEASLGKVQADMDARERSLFEP